MEPHHLWSKADDEERRELLGRLERDEGATEEAEQWITRLQKIDPLFQASDHMLGLERHVRARHILEQLTAAMGSRLTTAQLIDLVRRLQRAEGTEAEIAAWLLLVERNVPDPAVADLIYNFPENLTAEEIVGRALAYQPITLGPASESD